MQRPVLAVGDGALEFWAALREALPQTREQRDWVHKVVNVLDCLPKSAQPAARKVLGQIRDAEDRDWPFPSVRRDVPKTMVRLVDDRERLLQVSRGPRVTRS